MSIIAADVIRTFATEALIIATLRNGMIGATSDTNKLVMKDLATGTGYFFSDDNKQCLLAGPQTITGDKTLSGTTVLSGPVTVSGVTTHTTTLLMGTNNQLRLRESGNSISSSAAGLIEIDANTTLKLGSVGGDVNIGNAIASQNVLIKSGASGKITLTGVADDDIDFTSTPIFNEGMNITTTAATATLQIVASGSDMKLTTDTEDLVIGADTDLRLSPSQNIVVASPLNLATGGALNLLAGTTSVPSFNIPSGVAPSSPGNGDFWSDGTNLFTRMAGVTKTIAFV